ncbi:unnamed protein product [Malus baccata var. baccata]
MENGKLARFTYGDLCVVGSISSSSTFNQICIDLCSRFKGLRVGCFELRYGLNENPNCVLDCDADVLNMLMVLDVVGKSIVEILYLKNDKNRISAECSRNESDGCLWRVYASKCDINNFFVIRKLHNLHTCKGMIRKKKNKVVGREFVASFIKDKVQSNPLIKPKEIISNLKQFYGLDIDYSTAYFGKQMAVFELNGDDVDAYKFLPWYVESARSSNPGSVFELENVSTLFPKAAGEGLKKKMMNLLANCAYACTPSDFDDCMAEFKDNGQGHVKNFLCDLPKENYVIAHFPGKRWGSMSNALSESFNVMVSNSRCMPLMDLLEDIRVRLMGSMAEKRIFGQNIHTILCPKKENEMKLMLKEDLEKPNVDTIINGVRPSITKIPSGRPKKTRIKSAGEISGSKKTITCSSFTKQYVEFDK